MRYQTRIPVAVALCALLVGAGCGSSDDGNGTGGEADSSGGSGAGLSTAVQAKVAAGYKGSFAPPPSESSKPEPGKNVWFIPLASSVNDFHEKGGIFDAAKAMGWKLTEFDGKYSPDNIVSGIRQAVADDADGIITYLVDCSTVKSALADARAAGVPVVAGAAVDCDEADPSQPSGFAATTRYKGTESDKPLKYTEFLGEFWGPLQAQALVAGTGGKAKVIDVTETDLPAVVAQDKGLKQELADACAKCEVVETVEFVGGDVGTPLRQKIEQALSANPDADAIASPYDSIALITKSAIQTSGRADSIYHVAAEGKASVMDAIRDDKGVQAAVGLSMPWELWSLLDLLNRQFAGGKPPADGWPSGNGSQIIDAKHNLPTSGVYEPPVDFRASYLRSWGVE